MTAMHLCPNMGTRRTQGGDRLTVGMRSDRPNSPITGLKGSPPRVLQGVKWASEGCLKPQIWVLSLALHPADGHQPAVPAPAGGCSPVAAHPTKLTPTLMHRRPEGCQVPVRSQPQVPEAGGRPPCIRALVRRPSRGVNPRTC